MEQTQNNLRWSIAQFVIAVLLMICWALVIWQLYF